MSKEEWSNQLWQYIGMLLVAVILPPVYWLCSVVYLIVQIVKHIQAKPEN
jgi:hypothetical protein